MTSAPVSTLKVNLFDVDLDVCVAWVLEFHRVDN